MIQRAFTHLSMYKHAIDYFEKSIKYYKKEETKDNFGRQAAYNIAVLYKKMGNLNLARKMIKDYLIL